MKSLISILLVIFLLCFSCKEPELPFIPLDKEMEAYFATAGEGSLYIYQDSASSELDSVVIIKKTTRDNYNFDHIGGGFLLRYDSQKTEDFRTDITTNDSRFQFEVIYGTGASHKVIKEDGAYSPKGFVTILPAVTIHGQTYTDVLEVRDNGLHYKRFQFAKEVGCILKESFSPAQGLQTWKLIKYELK
jgi:hypothetical protein